ncbi:MAG: acyltransferase, partial [Candidatus Hermodarchaeota archaeon]
MSEDSKNDEDSDNNNEEEIVKEEQSLQFHLYIILFFIIYYGSWLIPGFIFFSYVLFFFKPYFLDITNFLAIFTEIKPLLALLSMPLVLIIGYYVRLFLIGIITKIFWKITERISPSKNGIIPRNIRSKTANYYHLRSFILKYGKNVYGKGLFPWLSTWFYNFIGTSKIGKGTTIEESVGSDKFIEVGKNCYIGVNSTLASHLLTGIFGNINYFKIHLGDNVTLASMNQIGPGTEIYDNAFMLPLACCTKHNVVKGKYNYYFGIPQRKIFKKKIMSWLDLSEEDLKKNKNPEMYIKRKGVKVKEEETKEIIEEVEDEEEDFEEDIDISEEAELKDVSTLTNEDLALDFTTSSAISRINIKFLAVYLPIFWLSGLLVAIYWYGYSMEGMKLSSILFFPIALISMLYLFILGVLLFSKLLILLVNLIHKPKEGTFLAQIGDTDYEFWMLRTELKKITLWLLRNSPLP